MIAADCHADGCVWRQRVESTVEGMTKLVGLIERHCRSKHPRACREIRVVIHAAGEHCDHERPE